jgi:hypothetical protein
VSGGKPMWGSRGGGGKEKEEDDEEFLKYPYVCSYNDCSCFIWLEEKAPLPLIISLTSPNCFNWFSEEPERGAPDDNNPSSDAFNNNLLVHSRPRRQ